MALAAAQLARVVPGFELSYDTVQPAFRSELASAHSVASTAPTHVRNGLLPVTLSAT